MAILGVSCNYHDAAACLYDRSGVIAAAEEERFSRRKHDSGFPRGAITAVLAMGGLDARDVEHVVFYEKPLIKFARILEMTVDSFPRGIAHFVPAMEVWLREKLWIANRIRSSGLASPIAYVQHHVAHAASAFYASPFDESAVLTLDGVGERATTTVGRGVGRELRLEDEIHFPHSLGLLYSVFTAFLGFEVNEGEYKLMGLAGYGNPRYANDVRRLIHMADDGSFHLDLRYVAYHRGPSGWTNEFIELFGPPFAGGALERGIDERAADVAASVQLVVEEAILRLAQRARILTGSRRLAFAGGVAQNVLANTRLLREGVFEEVFVPPAPGDSGGAIGAAAYLAHAVLGWPRPSGHGAYLGPAYSDREIREAVVASRQPFIVLEPDALAREAARMIADGAIIGWFQGRMEFGPRALGSRSILADPRDVTMKRRVNETVKYREEFRPFAPAVAYDDVTRYFEDQFTSPFMSFAARVRPEVRSQIPAVTHVDGTARLQTVRRDDNPIFYELLNELGRITGHRVVLNTSFNIRGEPIVASPRDAIDCFLRTSLDALFVGNLLMRAERRPSAPVEELIGRRSGMAVS